ncbi:MAG TPA: hypothetical protein VHZ95_04675 [Polyangiales bacterium]|nr:hypothetical protein [Polyangiales bacterium]
MNPIATKTPMTVMTKVAGLAPRAELGDGSALSCIANFCLLWNVRDSLDTVRRENVWQRDDSDHLAHVRTTDHRKNRVPHRAHSRQRETERVIRMHMRHDFLVARARIHLIEYLAKLLASATLDDRRRDVARPHHSGESAFIGHRPGSQRTGRDSLLRFEQREAGIERGR